MDCSTPGPPVHHQLPEFTQTHAHWVSDAIQPSHPLSSPSPPALSLSQYQGLLQWVGSSHQVAKVLAFQLQRQSFQRSPPGKFTLKDFFLPFFWPHLVAFGMLFPWKDSIWIAKGFASGDQWLESFIISTPASTRQGALRPCVEMLLLRGMGPRRESIFLW